MLNWLFKTSPNPKAPRTAIGLMSGTSLDGLDACLVQEVDSSRIEVIRTLSTPLSESLRTSLRSIIESGTTSLSDLLSVESEYTDQVIAQCQILIESSETPIAVIGFHGQTIWHAPEIGSTLQIGLAERLAEQTKTPVAYQFRRGDMARGGQGAPLAPLFHDIHFRRETENVAVLNLGGIANLSLLIPGQHTTGWDLGPANTLSDTWHQMHQQMPFDRDGAFAASGTVHETLLTQLLSDPYFVKEAPKSTGREYFSKTWLEQALHQLPPIDPADVQATLNQLTAELVNKALPDDIDILVVCGGGIHNAHLMDAIDDAIDPLMVTSEAFSIDPDFVEAACFGWLGLKSLDDTALPTRAITGSDKPGVLGTIIKPATD